MNDYQRLKTLIEVLKNNGTIRNQQHFAEITGLNKSVISSVLQNKRKFSEQYIDKICKKIDFVNKEWLLLGVGDILLDVSNNTDEKDKIISLYEKLEKRQEIIEKLREEIEDLKRELETSKKALINVENVPTANVG